MTCTAEEQALFQQTRGASIVCFTRGDSIGLTLVAESAFISLLAVLAVFTYICVSMDYFISFAKLTALGLAERGFGPLCDNCIYGEPAIRLQDGFVLNFIALSIYL